MITWLNQHRILSGCLIFFVLPPRVAFFFVHVAGGWNWSGHVIFIGVAWRILSGQWVGPFWMGVEKSNTTTTSHPDTPIGASFKITSHSLSSLGWLYIYKIIYMPCIAMYLNVYYICIYNMWSYETISRKKNANIWTPKTAPQSLAA